MYSLSYYILQFKRLRNEIDLLYALQMFLYFAMRKLDTVTLIEVK